MLDPSLLDNMRMDETVFKEGHTFTGLRHLFESSPISVWRSPCHNLGSLLA